MKKGSELIALNIVHKALLAGQVIFGVIAFFLVYIKKTTPAMAANDKLFQIAAILLSAAGFFAGTAIFKKKLLAIRDSGDGNAEKFAAYRAVCILRWALLEGPAMFCLVAFFVVGNYAFLAFAAMLVLIFVMMAPSKNKVMMQLGLSEEELDKL